MADTKPVSAPPSINLPQLISALQALGIGITVPPPQSEPAPALVSTPLVPAPAPVAPAPLVAANSQSASDTVPRAASARISSPWVPTSVAPMAAPATDTVQQQVGSPSVPSTTTATASDNTPASGFTCPHCLSIIHRISTQTWYTVTAGRNVGVFSGWHRVQPLVTGVPHASFRKYSSEAAATAAFEEATAEGLVVVIN